MVGGSCPRYFSALSFIFMINFLFSIFQCINFHIYDNFIFTMFQCIKFRSLKRNESIIDIGKCNFVSFLSFSFIIIKFFVPCFYLHVEQRANSLLCYYLLSYYVLLFASLTKNILLPLFLFHFTLNAFVCMSNKGSFYAKVFFLLHCFVYMSSKEKTSSCYVNNE